MDIHDIGISREYVEEIQVFFDKHLKEESLDGYDADG